MDKIDDLRMGAALQTQPSRLDRLSAATTTAVSLLATFTSAVKREWRSTKVTMTTQALRNETAKLKYAKKLGRARIAKRGPFAGGDYGGHGRRSTAEILAE